MAATEVSSSGTGHREVPVVPDVNVVYAPVSTRGSSYSIRIEPRTKH